MSIRRALQHLPLPSTASRSFSSSPAASTSKLSPLHKVTLARAERAAKGIGKGKKVKTNEVVTLEEAGRILAVRSPSLHLIATFANPSNGHRPCRQGPRTQRTSSTSRRSPPLRSS
jgi:hypothetical protein